MNELQATGGGALLGKRLETILNHAIQDHAIEWVGAIMQYKVPHQTRNHAAGLDHSRS